MNYHTIEDIPEEIADNPAPVTCGPFEIGISTTTSASPEGEEFLSIGNPYTGRSVARVSRFASIDREDMGIAHLLAASFDLRRALELFMIGECFCDQIDGEHTARCEAACEALNKANGDDPYL